MQKMFYSSLVEDCSIVTLSRAMYGHHGATAVDPGRKFDALSDNPFPDMPAALNFSLDLLAMSMHAHNHEQH